MLSVLGTMASDVRTIIWKGFGRKRSRNILEELRKTMNYIIIVRILAEIRAEDLLITSLERYL